jgi:hypothetical protein
MKEVKQLCGCGPLAQKQVSCPDGMTMGYLNWPLMRKDLQALWVEISMEGKDVVC